MPQPNSRKDRLPRPKTGREGCRRVGKRRMKVPVDFHTDIPVRALALPTVSSTNGVCVRTMGVGKSGYVKVLVTGAGAAGGLGWEGRVPRGSLGMSVGVVPNLTLLLVMPDMPAFLIRKRSQAIQKGDPDKVLPIYLEVGRASFLLFQRGRR